MRQAKTTRTDANRRDGAQQHPVGGKRFDWVMIALSAWLLGGAFVDGWAHTHGKVDESFFTPWHAILYSGFLAVACFLVVHMTRNLVRGAAWKAALPTGYALSMLGALIFWLGGLGDLVWHELFGIEENVEALLSPTHLLLACGVWFIVSGPFRAAWQRPEATAPGWGQQAPALLSLTFMLSVCTFITQIAHPIANLWSAGSPRHPIWLFEEMGVMSLLWDTGLLMGLTLVALRRWTLPPGTFTLVLTLNAMAMGFLYYHGPYPLVQVAARAVAGLLVDSIYYRLKPSVQRPRALRRFAFAMPVVMHALYFLTVQLTGGIWWSIHLWMGIIVLTGIIGVLLSYLLVPPPIPAQARDVMEPR